MHPSSDPRFLMPDPCQCDQGILRSNRKLSA
jgi:hypothetical protein